MENYAELAYHKFYWGDINNKILKKNKGNRGTSLFDLDIEIEFSIIWMEIYNIEDKMTFTLVYFQS